MEKKQQSIERSGQQAAETRSLGTNVVAIAQFQSPHQVQYPDQLASSSSAKPKSRLHPSVIKQILSQPQVQKLLEVKGGQGVNAGPKRSFSVSYAEHPSAGSIITVDDDLRNLKRAKMIKLY